MANLYADSDFFITEVNYGDYGGSNAYNVTWSHTSNSTTANFTVLAEALISNVNSVGAVTSIDLLEEITWPSGNTFTTSVVAASSSNGSGSGLTLQCNVDVSGGENYYIINQGTGYNFNDEVVFPSAPLHRTSDLKVLVDRTDGSGIDYFPTGLANADVVSNAVPLMKIEYGF